MFGFLDSITPGIGHLISGGLGFLGQMDTNAQSQDNSDSANAFNAYQAQLNRDFQTDMSNTAYQRQVSDMSKAGLNPMLAYMKGGGATTPTGSSASATLPQYTSPIQGAATYKLTSAQSAKTEAEVPNVQAHTKVLQSQYDLNNAQYDLVLQNTEKVFKESRNLDTEQDRIKSVIVNLAESSALMAQQGETQVSIRNVNLATIANLQAHSKLYAAMTSSTNFEAQLKQFDVQAAQGVGNFGREYNQVKPVIDLLRSLKR